MASKVPYDQSTWRRKVVEKIILAIVGVAVSAAIAPWVPFWPTEPVFRPGPPSSRIWPTDIPFFVENRSSLMGVTRMSISCEVIELVVQVQGSQVTVLGPSFSVAQLNRLPAGTTSYHSCAFSRGLRLVPDGQVIKARIRFNYSYYPFLRAEGAPSVGHSPIFVWSSDLVPPQWTEERTILL